MRLKKENMTTRSISKCIFKEKMFENLQDPLEIVEVGLSTDENDTIEEQSNDDRDDGIEIPEPETTLENSAAIDDVKEMIDPPVNN